MSLFNRREDGPLTQFYLNSMDVLCHLQAFSSAQGLIELYIKLLQVMAEEQDPNSLLDTDLYKITMHYVVWSTYPNAEVNYGFINRSKSLQPFTRLAFEALNKKIQRFKTRILTAQEKEWLKSTCPYLSTDYLDYLERYRFMPDEHLKVRFLPTKPSAHSIQDDEYGDLEISIKGLWVDTILYEVPLLSMISEAYFEIVDRDWTYDFQVERAMYKAGKLFEAGCTFSEFGTRRRRSWKAQLLVLTGLQKAAITPRTFTTSNLWMARRFGIQPIGTIAHEFIMAEAALNGYEDVNMRTMTLWEASFIHTSKLWIALTDTFTTKSFFKELANHPTRAKRCKGFRQDSGDPKEFVKNAKNVWDTLGIDPLTKLIVFSDSLNTVTCLELHRFCQEQGVKEVYGIGTHFTNDFYQSKPDSQVDNIPSKPLNIVIKLLAINDTPCIKLSDDEAKAIGPVDKINEVRRLLGI
ncbi:hypothetical protein O181_026121 [Austropuccinia psidii MF-1]|uniref:Nicotinate phosphoribosyltransferase n=1 Tax=Austropuccinia psidii MF-1 TaxID=1389203 RepID=A0A9Q3CJV9_9BASI|nr:hypothetical protein [Austropuccinia psidii MF-1]